jgi:hypothetical protein
VTRLIYLNLIFQSVLGLNVPKFRGNFSSHPPHFNVDQSISAQYPLFSYSFFPPSAPKYRSRGAALLFGSPVDPLPFNPSVLPLTVKFIAALRKNPINNRNRSKSKVMHKLSNEEIEMLFQVAEKESPTFSKLYKETLEKANSRPPQPLKDYQPLCDQIELLTESIDYAYIATKDEGYYIPPRVCSLFRSTIAKQISIVKNDIDSRSSVEEVEHALTCLANMALMLSEDFIWESEYIESSIYDESLCILKVDMEEMGTVLRDRGVTICNDLQEKIRKLEVVYSHPKFDHIPTVFWAGARGKRMLDEIQSNRRWKASQSGRSRDDRYRYCEICHGSIWGSRECPQCFPVDEVLRSLESLDCGNPRKRLRSD